MKLVRENINEVNFERGQDPKKAMNIGVFSKHIFKDESEAAEYLFDYLPAILGTKEIPQNIIKELHSPCPHPTYEENCPLWYKISKYIRNYITLTTDQPDDDIQKLLAKKLEFEGYKK